MEKSNNTTKNNKESPIVLQARINSLDENFLRILSDNLDYLGNLDVQGKINLYSSGLSKSRNTLAHVGENDLYLMYYTRFLSMLLEKMKPEEREKTVKIITGCMEEERLDLYSIKKLCEVIAPYIELKEILFFQDDCNFEKVVSYMHKIEKTYRIYIIHYQVLRLEHSEKNKRIDKYLVSSMEKREQYNEALQLVLKVLQYDVDQVAIRTLFRVCRKLNDYTAAENYIDKHPEIERVGEFNTLYELVFYYSKIGDISARNKALEKMEECSKKSIPIMKTLYNFYLQFGMLDKASKIKEKIFLREKGKHLDKISEKEKEEETELTLFDTIKTLFEEREHSRKLISISELLKGFAHELGQPITNIRYRIQLYQMEMERGVDKKEELNQVFNDILSQTLRIRELLSRFSPIATEKEENSHFSVQKEIQAVFQEFDSRLQKENVNYSVDAETDFILFGDRIKFDQIFYNLVGNSLYAINENHVPGEIKVEILEKTKFYIINFQDNGTGIAPEYLDKVFEPFFTTKEKEENGGGEGLGLYIVWNIVQMFGGKIRVDRKFKQGARFIIELPKKEGNEKDE